MSTTAITQVQESSSQCMGGRGGFGVKTVKVFTPNPTPPEERKVQKGQNSFEPYLSPIKTLAPKINKWTQEMREARASQLRVYELNTPSQALQRVQGIEISTRVA